MLRGQTSFIGEIDTLRSRVRAVKKHQVKADNLIKEQWFCTCGFYGANLNSLISHCNSIFECKAEA